MAHLEPALLKDDPRSAVLREAERRKADVIVLGTRGRSGIRRLLVGSVAEWVVRHALSDVLIASPVHVSLHGERPSTAGRTAPAHYLLTLKGQRSGPFLRYRQVEDDAR